ncbi:hypothetical protein NDU88_004045 [Pleurodeles waltl]|uniref:Uncharacterized protein n=1 Tax=Pleurodeles waltl TaxID=8319 RepID=A0AAV7QDR0_PLEWA|nr:hypothetical protein NDU88_004045 [Pleurodeles waltl]
MGPSFPGLRPGTRPGVSRARPTGSAPLLWTEEKPEGVSCPPWQRDTWAGEGDFWNGTLGLAKETSGENASRGKCTSLMAGREAGRCVLSPLATGRLGWRRRLLERTRPAGSAPLLWPEEKPEGVSCPPWQRDAWAGEGDFWRERIPWGARLSYGQKRSRKVCPVPPGNGTLGLAKETSGENTQIQIQINTTKGPCMAW